MSRNRKRRRAIPPQGELPEPPGPVGPVEIFRAGWQGVKVRFTQAWVVLGFAPWALWASADIAFNPAPDFHASGEVVSWGARYFAAALVFVSGVGGGVGMLVYGWCYVMRVVWDPEADCCHVTLAGFGVPARLTLPRATEERWNHRDGMSRAGGIIVNAPWWGIRLPGRRFPLILDEQGDLWHPLIIDRVLLGGGSDLGMCIDDGRKSRRSPETRQYLKWVEEITSPRDTEPPMHRDGAG